MFSSSKQASIRTEHFDMFIINLKYDELTKKSIIKPNDDNTSKRSVLIVFL